jgi:hypothetical protein
VIENGAHGRTRLRRARPLLAFAAVAFAIGAIVGAGHHRSPDFVLAERFAASWAAHNYPAMYADVDAATRRDSSLAQFAGTYRRALATATATATGLHVAGKARSAGAGAVSVPVTVRTRIFGKLALAFTMRAVPGSSGAKVIAWSPSLEFPGMRPGERLSRRLTLPRRATLLARDGTVLAQSSEAEADLPATETTRDSPLGAAADAALGSIGPIPAARRASLEASGVPGQASVGISGLELALDASLRGSPGGALLAGTRVLAFARSRAAPPLRTTISPTLQRAAVAALGEQLGGVVVMAPASGQILAVAGIGLDGLQPPGSTFKMVTLAGALQAKIATPHTVFPYATFATLDGVRLNNANGEECGGSLELAFAVSCNSVFTPLGVKLGAPRLVAMAESLGFNHQPPVGGAAESTLPPASEIQGELDVGSTAIGQGRVLATPLQMATVAATIADGGTRPQPTFIAAPGRPPRGPRAIEENVAHIVRRLMIGVVRNGTGTSAAIPGITVAGKTGTAELKSACKPPGGAGERGEEAPETGACAGSESAASNTDAWFAAFAPALHPRIVVCVLLVKDGAGGDTAAPVAREVLETGLRPGA